MQVVQQMNPPEKGIILEKKKSLYDDDEPKRRERGVTAMPPPLDQLEDSASAHYHYERWVWIQFPWIALANAATHLDKTDLAGRPMNVGRPRGYAEPTQGHVPSFEPCRFDPPYDVEGDERKWR